MIHPSNVVHNDAFSKEQLTIFMQGLLDRGLSLESSERFLIAAGASSSTIHELFNRQLTKGVLDVYHNDMDKKIVDEHLHIMHLMALFRFEHSETGSILETKSKAQKMGWSQNHVEFAEALFMKTYTPFRPTSTQISSKKSGKKSSLNKSKISVKEMQEEVTASLEENSSETLFEVTSDNRFHSLDKSQELLLSYKETLVKQKDISCLKTQRFL